MTNWHYLYRQIQAENRGLFQLPPFDSQKFLSKSNLWRSDSRDTGYPWFEELRPHVHSW